MRFFREYENCGGILCCFVRGKETPELSLGGVSRSSIFYFSRSEKRAEISFKIAKIG